MSRFLIRIFPASGRSRPIMWRRRVLLPQPLPPRITMVSPRRVRVDYNNPLAGKTLKYKYRIDVKAVKPEEKVATILEIDFGRKEDFEITANEDSVDIKLPEVCKYDQFWLIAKFKIINDLREYAGFTTVRFIEEYVKKEEPKEEETAEGIEKDKEAVEGDKTVEEKSAEESVEEKTGEEGGEE